MRLEGLISSSWIFSSARLRLVACRDHQVVQTTANRIIEILPDGSIIDKVSTYDDYLENNADARKRTVYVASRDEDMN